MPLADVTNPVIINATKAIQRESGSFLRRVCFVSFGETNLAEKKYKEVYSSDYETILNGHTELSNSLSNFFSKANNKSCVVLELGKQDGTPLTDDYNNKMKYLATQSWFKDEEFYEYIYTDKGWETSHETTDIIKAYWNTVNTFNESQYQQYLSSNRLSDSVESLKKYMNSIDVNWDDGYYNYLATTDTDFKALLTLTNLNDFITNREAAHYDDDDYKIFLEENGTFDDDYVDKIKNLNEFISQKLYPCYIFVLPNKISAEVNLVKELFSKYNSLDIKTYFFVNLDKTENIDNPLSYYQKCKDNKCVAMFYDNTQDEVGLASIIAGLFASFVFDISDITPASPFNFKLLEGVAYEDIPASTQQNLIQKSISFIGDQAQNTVLLNGRYADTHPIDYWYQWDLVAFQLESDLKHLILNGVNNPMNIVKYDQGGIDILKSRVKATLDKMISWGCITDYSARLNPATNVLEGKGDITSIDFNTYVRNNPEDYENEIYRGISFYLRIGKYIRQVVINATLG